MAAEMKRDFKRHGWIECAQKAQKTLRDCLPGREIIKGSGLSAAELDEMFNRACVARNEFEDRPQRRYA